jgi:hypothetical protein
MPYPQPASILFAGSFYIRQRALATPAAVLITPALFFLPAGKLDIFVE